MGRLVDIASALVAIGAGIYLLSTQAVASDSIFNPFLHGIGAYFIAKGLFIARSTHLQAESAGYLEKLTELGALRHQRETWEDDTED